LLVLPYEYQRQSTLYEFTKSDIYLGELEFWQYHTLDSTKADRLTKQRSVELGSQKQELDRLKKLIPGQHEHGRLSGLIGFIRNLLEEISTLSRLMNDVQCKLQQAATKCELVLH
jgi:hypothetical protein